MDGRTDGKLQKISQRVVVSLVQEFDINAQAEKSRLAGITPNWKKMERETRKKYGKKITGKIFPDVETAFFQKNKNWAGYVKSVNKRIKIFPPKAGGKVFGRQAIGGGGLGDAFGLNFYAWTLFLNCDDKEILPIGIRWTEMAAILDTSAYRANYVDTKANLLYRSGRIEDAIKVEESALQIDQNNKSIIEVLGKMKAGKPTWPESKSKLK